MGERIHNTVRKKPLLNEEYVARLESTLLKRYGRYLQHGDRFAVVRSEAAADAWTLAVTFENADQSLHLPVELALVGSENPKLRNDEARDVLIDFLDYVFDRYFQGGRQITLPLDWAALPFGEYSVRARGWEKNMRLEHAADRLLAGEPVEDVLDG